MSNALWQIDKGDPRPLYYQVKELIRSGILRGDWKPNELLPTEDALCNRLGVSRVTVSRAINDLVTEGLIVRVQGKGTFVAGPGTKNEASKTLGLVLHRTEVNADSYFNDVMRGIDDVARELGYRIMLLTFNSQTPGVEEGHFCLAEVMDKELGGVLITAEQIKRVELKRLRANSIPFVVINYKDDDAENCVTIDWASGSYEAAKYLIVKGHRRIGYLGGMVETFDLDKQKYAGFTKALSEAGLTLEPELLKQCPYTERERVTPLVEELLELSPRPTAIFCGDDIIAARVLQTVQKRNLKVPEEISIVGFGNMPISTRLFPELTTVDVPRYELGRKAMMAFAGLKSSGRGYKEKDLCLPSRLIIRHTT